MKSLTATTSDLMPKSEPLRSTGRHSGLKHFVIVSLFVIGLVVCVISLLCIFLLPTFITNQISKRLVLKNNSLLLERWSRPNVPMYFKVWVFDVQNAQQVIDKRGIKPQLKEIGPFVFHLKRQKDVVSFAGDNLYYTERKIYHFAPELSCCAINTTVTIPNIPLVAVVDRALSYNLPLVGRFIPRLINRAIQSLREQLFVKKQVREILFDGYEVDLLKMVSRVGSLVGLPQTNQKFALLKGRNDTWRPEQDGVWAINTGARDRHMFGRVSSWNSYKKLPFWASPGCNTINGSDGTLFPPPIKKTEPLYIFNQELCRTVNLIYDRQSDIRAIKAYRFVLNPLNFAHTMSGSRSRLNNIRSGSSSSSAAQTLPEDERVNNPLGSMLASSTPAQPQVTPIQLLQEQQRQQTQSQQQQQQHQNNQDPINAANSDNSRRVGDANSSPLNPAELNAAIQLQNSRWKNNLKPLQTNQTPLPEAQHAAKMIQAAQEAHLDQRSQSQINPFTCFCDRKTTNLNGANVCEFDGLIDLSKCTKQAQVIFGSMPHFYQSDPRLPRQVIGLEPNASKHTTYLDIEPNTGLVLGGKRRVQLNLIIKRNNEVDGFENINDMLVPLVWFEESALIPEESARKFKSLYTDRIRMVNIILTTLFLAALALLAIDTRLLINHYTSCFNMKISCKISSTSAPSSSPSSSSFSLHNSKTTSSHLSSSNTVKTTDNPQCPLTGKKKSKSSNLRANLTKTLPVKAVAATMLKGSCSSQNYNQKQQKSLAEQEEADYLKRTRRSSNGQLNLPLLSNTNTNTNLNNGNNQTNFPPPAAAAAVDLSSSTTKNIFVGVNKEANNNKKSTEFSVKYKDTLLIDNILPPGIDNYPAKEKTATALTKNGFHGQINTIDSYSNDNNDKFNNKNNLQANSTNEYNKSIIEIDSAQNKPPQSRPNI